MDVGFLTEYLVKISVDQNKPELQKLQKTMADFTKEMERHADGWAKAFVATGVTVAGVYAGIASAAVGLAEKVSQADLSYQLFATRMMTSLDIARKVKIATDALGHSIEEIIWNRELHNRFDLLLKDQTRLSASLGPDFERNMKRIRDMRFEFTRLQVATDYLAMTFVNRLFKAFGTDGERFMQRLQNITQWAIGEVPQIADKLVTTMKPVLADIATSAGTLGKELQSATSWLLQLIGVLSGDTQLQKGAVTFENLALAIQHTFYRTSMVVEEIGILIDSMAALAKLGGPGGPGAHMEAFQQWKYDVKQHLDRMDKLALTDLTNKDILEHPAAQASPMLGPLARFQPSTAGGTRPLSMHQQQAMSASIASQARELAKQVSAQTGVPADIIFAQWAHETGGFMNRGARSLNNLAGIKAGSDYRQFSSLTDFADYYSRLITKRHPSATSATTVEQFAAALKEGGYYEDSYANYARGMRSWYGKTSGDFTINGGLHVSVSVDKTNASADDIGMAVSHKVKDTLGGLNTRTLLQLTSPWGN